MQFSFCRLQNENSKQNPSETLETNIIGTAKLANECIKQNIKGLYFLAQCMFTMIKEVFIKPQK